MLLIAGPGWACTLWAVSGPDVQGGGTLLVKNRDFPPGHPTHFALVAPENGYRILAMLSAFKGGTTVVGGVNEKGLAMVTATVGTLDRTERLRRTREYGLRPPIRRILARYASLRELLDDPKALEGTPPVFALIADATGVAVLESSGLGWRVQAVPQGEIATHTNHPILFGLPDIQDRPDAPGSLARLARIRALLAGLPKPATLSTVAALSRDAAAGPDNSIFRTGSTPDKARTVGMLAVHLPPDGGAPVIMLRVVDPVDGREAEETLRLDAAFWNAAPPPGNARVLLR